MTGVKLALPALAQLPAERQASSAALTARLVERIAAAGGALGFERFMEALLYEPELGYYMRDADPFGAAGDFITAPHSSALFSRALAAPCAAVLQGLGTGLIAEIGAGSGVMARDLLLELHRRDELPDEYRIVERSPALVGRQRAILASLPERARARVRWRDHLGRMDGVVLANELLDALPVQRFVVGREGARPLLVGWQHGGFHWVEGEPDAELDAWYAALCAELPVPLPRGYRSERCPGLDRAAQDFCAPLRRGLAIFLDYGYPRQEYYHAQRLDGTLLAHFEHRAHADPFVLVGQQDVTASVDFTAFARAATARDLAVCGYTSQAWFLLGCGFDALLSETMQALGPGTPGALAEAGAARRLLLPGEMGERVQVIGLTRGLDSVPGVFRLRDQRGRLGRVVA